MPRTNRMRWKAHTDRNRYPLRRVVGYGLGEYGEEVERLECGHIVRRRCDIFGPTNAVRRRCRWCFNAILDDTADRTHQR